MVMRSSFIKFLKAILIMITNIFTIIPKYIRAALFLLAELQDVLLVPKVPMGVSLF